MEIPAKPSLLILAVLTNLAEAKAQPNILVVMPEILVLVIIPASAISSSRSPI